MKTSKVKRERNEYAVQSVTNAISILEMLGESEHEQSMGEIYTKLKLTKSNVNKLLATLERLGYVENNQYTGNFRLGVKTFQISQTYINKLSLPEISLPLMKDLRDHVKESVYISILHKENVVYMSVVETDLPVRVLPRMGNVGPAYATATGKVQLAALEDREIEAYYPGEFVKYTPRTISSMNRLLEEMNKVRRDGYAVDDEEYEQGVRCVAAPVKNFMGNVIAGITISAPVERMGNTRIEKELLPRLLETADKLSIKFGYR